MVQIDEERIQSHLDEVVRFDGRGDIERVAGCRGGSAVRGEEIRTQRGPASIGRFWASAKGPRKSLGLVESLAGFYPEAKWQRCVVHFYRDVWTAVPTGKVKAVAAMLKAIHAQEDAAAAKEKAHQVAKSCVRCAWPRLRSSSSTASTKR